ncbi:MAG: helicase [Deltaproteobacteria bacterium]|nr:MAG: helicase [Deltaproteobacteria bacterium]
MQEQNLTLTVSSDCLLIGISIELEQAVKKQLTIDNPQYIAARKFGRWVGKGIKPQLKYYEVVPGGLRFPRGFSNRAVLLCRKHLGVSPEIIDQRRLVEPIDLDFSGQLRPYQQAAVDAVMRHSFGVLEAGTGSGKTVMALALIALRKQPALVIVHTKELLYQWQERAETFLGLETGLIGDGRFNPAPLTIGIVNSVRKKLDELVPLFGHLIIDECHRVPATLFTEVVSRFDSHYMLGLSATAFRKDDGLTKLIYYFMGDRIHRVDQEKLQQTGAVIRPKVVRKATPFTYHYRGDYQALIKALTLHQGRNLQIIQDIITQVKRDPGGTALIVSDRVSHCRLFEQHLEQSGIRVELLTGQTPKEQRHNIVKDVQAQKVEALIATIQLISEGFDCSGLSSLFLTTPITFEGRLLQVIGRIMRPAKNKQAVVYDYVDDAIPPLQRSANIRLQVLTNL